MCAGCTRLIQSNNNNVVTFVFLVAGRGISYRPTGNLQYCFDVSLCGWSCYEKHCFHSTWILAVKTKSLWSLGYCPWSRMDFYQHYSQSKCSESTCTDRSGWSGKYRISCEGGKGWLCVVLIGFSVIIIVFTLWAGQCVVLFPAGTGEFTLLQNVHICCGSHPACCLVDIGGKATRAWSWPLTPVYCWG